MLAQMGDNVDCKMETFYNKQEDEYTSIITDLRDRNIKLFVKTEFSNENFQALNEDFIIKEEESHSENEGLKNEAEEVTPYFNGDCFELNNTENEIQEPEYSQKNNKCDICTYTSTREDLLKRHICFNLKDPSLMCQYCNYETDCTNRLKHHNKLQHSIAGIYLCDHEYCNFKSVYKSTLKKHLKKIHDYSDDEEEDNDTQMSPTVSDIADYTEDYFVPKYVTCIRVETEDDLQLSADSAESTPRTYAEEEKPLPTTTETHRSPKIGTPRRNRMPDFCFYCETNVKNFARHLKRKHYTENEVREIFSLPACSTERKNLISVLRKKGNYKNNKNDCLKPVKRMRNARAANNNSYSPCKYCLGFYRSSQLWLHIKRCKLSDGVPTSFSHRTDGQDLLVCHLEIDKGLKENVFPHMLPDKISLVAKSDNLICTFGAQYFNRHKEQQRVVHLCSKKMRDVAKLLIEIKKEEASIDCLSTALHPRFFDLIVRCAKKVAKYNPVKHSYGSPTYAGNIQSYLKQCCDVATKMSTNPRGSATEVANENDSDFESFKELLVHSWRSKIFTRTSTDSDLQMLNKTTIIPLLSDLKIFRNYLLVNSAESSEKLKTNMQDEKSYKILLETVFCRLLILNRMKMEELQGTLLCTYEEYGTTMTPTEKILLRTFAIIIRGKPVLFSADIREHVDQMVQLRSYFVDKSNVFLFPNVGTGSHITGHKILTKHIRRCGLQNIIVSTFNRFTNYHATITQILNMSASDVEDLIASMGLTSGLSNREEQTDDAFRIAKLSLLLMATEKGESHRYKGKILDEIDVDFDEDLNEDVIVIDIDNSDDQTEYQVSPASNLITKSSKLPKIGIRTLVPWTNKQKKFVKLFFESHIKSGRAPKKRECDELKSKYGTIFHNKTWKQIKVYIQNAYTKKSFSK